MSVYQRTARKAYRTWDYSDLALLISFAFAWWLGLYLLGRDPRNPQLRFAGLGLAAYALALGAGFLSGATAEPDPAAARLAIRP